MGTEKTIKIESIKPLFLPIEESGTMGNQVVQFATDDYNKVIGEALIDAKNDAEAISAFLSEFRDSPLTLQSYAKEIERLLLWWVQLHKRVKFAMTIQFPLNIGLLLAER